MQVAHSLRSACGGLVAAALLSSPASAAEPAAATGSVLVAQATPAAMAEYRRLLAQYLAARQQYEAVAESYWSTVADKRRLRAAKRRSGQDMLLEDYVLAQPPVYSGPPRPVDPSAPEEEPPPKYVPVVADFLRAAEQEFKFVPRQPQDELEYKRAYARLAAAAGLTKEQVVRIYGFESGGNGKYDVQAGLEYPRPGARAVSTALGYNQLLTTNSVGLMAEKGHRFIAVLQAKAAASAGEARVALERKIAVLKSMVAFTRTVPNAWSAHGRLAGTPKGLAVHALNLDVDVGPLLQVQKLLDSVVFARRQGHDAPLTAAELEMMNLTGDGNGFDMIRMPQEWRERVPTANFFQPGGYERNPIAVRNNVVAKLMAATDAKMDQEAKLQGAKDLAAAFPK